MLHAVLAIVVSAGVVCAGALLLGQGVLRLCGTREWSWLAAPVGLSGMMLLAVPALHVPGRSATVAAVLLVLALAALAAMVLGRCPRPPLGGLLAAAPVGLLVWVPFLSAGHAGTLGVSLNNDMASHLLLADAYRSPEIAHINGISSSYPIGPHALVAAIVQGTGFDTDLVFAGVTAAVPVLIALTALAALSSTARWPAKALVATLVGLPFLVAGYYGQGSFKELMQVLFVLGFALELRRFDPANGPLRWVPLGLIAAGTLCVYSAQGLLWPVALGGLWLAGLALTVILRGRPYRAPALAAVRAELVPLALAMGLVALALVPQLPRLARFTNAAVAVNGTGIEKSSLGNLAGPLPFWEAFGAWGSSDYRLPSVDQYAAGAWGALVLALVLAGAVWWLRRGDWMLPAAALACFAVWAFSNHTQSPYVAAKALVILSPIMMLVAVRPLVEGRWSPRVPRGWALAAPLLAAVLAVEAGGSTWQALRFSPVGPRAHVTELRQLRPLLGGRKTLFLGNDDFVIWELAGVPVVAPLIGIPYLPIRPEKQWEYARAHDIDTLDASVVNDYEWVITPRDAAGSELPPQLRLVRRTADFALYRRSAPLQPRRLLAEGEAPAAKLDCSTPEGRALSRRDGKANVRLGPVGVPVAPIAPGATATVPIPLGAGTWELVTPYTSPRPLEVTAGRLRRSLPANLDRPGPRYPIGRLTLARPETVEVRIRAPKALLTPATAVAWPTSVIAVPDFGERVIPLKRACGALVDWYRLSAR